MDEHWIDEDNKNKNSSGILPNPAAGQLINQRKAPERHQGQFSFLKDDWNTLQDIIHEMKKNGVKRAPNVVADKMVAAFFTEHGNGAGNLNE